MAESAVETRSASVGPALLDYSALVADSPVVKQARARRIQQVSVEPEKEASRTPAWALLTLFGAAALLGLLAASTVSEHLSDRPPVLVARPTDLPFERDLYLSDLQALLPVESTFISKGAATCVMSPRFSEFDFAARSRATSAARSFLAARAIPALLLRLPDGTVLAGGERGQEMRWFEAGQGPTDSPASPVRVAPVSTQRGPKGVEGQALSLLTQILQSASPAPRGSSSASPERTAREVATTGGDEPPLAATWPSEVLGTNG